MSGPKPIPSFGKALVVGGCGFLGGHIVSLILKRHPGTQIAVLDLRTSSNRNASPSVSYHDGDITDATTMQSIFSKVKPDVVFHTASPHFDAPTTVHDKVNIEGTDILLKAAQESGVKAFVYTSSASLVIDSSMTVVNADETWPLITGAAQPEHYTTTKAYAETAVLSANRTPAGFLTCAIRPAGIFGEGDVQLLPPMISACRKGQNKFQVGDNTNLSDFTYVENVVYGHLLAAQALLQTHNIIPTIPLDNEKVDGEAFFITNGQPVYFWDFARAVWHAAGDRKTAKDVWTLDRDFAMAIGTVLENACWVLGKKPNINRKQVRYSTMNRYYNIDKAKKRLGYEPLVSLDVGIKRGVAQLVEQEQKASEKKGHRSSSLALRPYTSHFNYGTSTTTMAQPTLPASAYEALDLPLETLKILTTPKSAIDDSAVAAPNLLQHEGDTSEQTSLPPNKTSIILYAELLLHIRTVTLYASLRTSHTRETKAKLSTDGYSITVTHEGESATIRMPIQVQGGGDAALSLPAQPPSKDLTVRLQVKEKEGTDLLGTLQTEERKANIVPWDGATLSGLKTVTVFCKACRNELVPPEKIREWRDLPNENWAEMMDFWHCHKPDEHHLHDQAHDAAMEKKGYAAGNRLEAAHGLAFVDLSGFLLKEQDCPGIKMFPSEGNSLVCKQCHHILGIPDANTQGWRVWKWCLSIVGSSSSNDDSDRDHAITPQITTTTTMTYNVQKWISARLLFLAENMGVRKFHIYSESSTSPSPSQTPVPSLLIWLFTPDLFYSSSITSTSHAAGTTPTRALKIFYRHQTYAPPQPGDMESTSIEDVGFPALLWDELRDGLGRSQRVLPESARVFQGWEVGLLERFDGGDISQ
ncbi:unnamed protein product [Periconia digitata]|uniref:Sterol-4-alpha-carboxylate 3-dehydrogenase ERG26, decarboxylating n=1 Tax=Periconia digitata TaxID=1303443 RepID=A0A9W4UA30_9PLEO|nr:unnamed protein product [Periconia digitata]